MLRSIIFAAATLAVSLQSSAEDVSCAQSRVSYLQCSFDVPQLANGQSTVVNTDTPLFKGAVAVSCKNGVVTTGQSACAPSDPTTCAIPSAQWFGKNGDACTHNTVPHVMDSGAKLTVQSVSGKGAITYGCQNGTASALEVSCSSESPAATAFSDRGNVSTQSVTGTTKSSTVSIEFVTPYHHATNPGAVQAAAIQACSQIDIYDDQRSVSYAYKSISYDVHAEKNPGDPNTEIIDFQLYTASCPIAADLRCDQDFVSEGITGAYNPRNGEHTNAPGLKELTKACTIRGFSFFDKLHYSNKVDGVVDLFEVVLTCSGKSAQCAAKPNLGDPTISSATSCTEASVYSGLIEVKRGEAVSTSAVLKQACEPLGFASLDSFSTPVKQDETGAFEYFTVTAQCSGYTKNDSEPLLPECKAPTDTDGGTVTPKTCDVGTVTGLLPAEQNPSTLKYTEAPSATMALSELCNANSYNELVSMNAERTVDPSLYQVTATCKGYSGPDRSSCEILGLCFGRELPSDSQEPSLVYNGKRYLNTCASKSGPPAELCKDCVAGNFSFTDPVTGNVCDIATPLQLSGGKTKVDFTNDKVHGTVDVSCNNASKSLTPGGAAVCYKSCPGDVVVGWDDKNGSKSCSQRIPSGIYKHGQEVSFGSSIAHTGNASVQCDGYTGQWVVKSGICKLDCAAGSSANWGSGTSGNGVNKTNLCAGTIPAAVRHGASGTLTNTTASSSGSTSYVCEDGSLNVSGGSCSVSCAASTQSWGGQCRASVPSLLSGGQSSVNHGSNPSNPYDSLTSGSATFACTDGAVSQVSGSCKYPTGTRASNWSNWTETSRSCSGWSPDPSTVTAGQTYTKTRSCTVNYRRSRDVYYTWNTGPDTYLRTENQSDTRTETESSSAVGTMSSCRYDANNYIEESDSDHSEYGTWGTSDRAISWVWNGQTVYSYRYSYSSRENPPKEEEEEYGSTSGYSSGRLIDSGGGGGVTDSYSYSIYEICN
jgi:hypothetical protein